MDQKRLNRILQCASGVFAVAAIVLLTIALVGKPEGRLFLPGGMACSAIGGTLAMLQRRNP